jgi:hypothetical protein
MSKPYKKSRLPDNLTICDVYGIFAVCMRDMDFFVGHTEPERDTGQIIVNSRVSMDYHLFQHTYLNYENTST